MLREILSIHQDLYAGNEFNFYPNLVEFFEVRYPSWLPQKTHNAYLLFDPEKIREIRAKYGLSDEEYASIRDGAHSLPQFVDLLFSYLAERDGKKRWVEKTPRNVHILGRLFRHFPKSKFIHVIRDGRDVVCSLRNYERRLGVGKDKSMKKCVAIWKDGVEAARKFKDDPRYIEVRYEDLVQDEEKTLRNICDFIGVPFSDFMLSHDRYMKSEEDNPYIQVSHNATGPVVKNRIGRWKKDLRKEDAEYLQKEAGSLLQELGYIQDSDWLQYYG